MILFLKNLLFTLVVPGTVGVYLPHLIARGRSMASGLILVPALTAIAAGACIYAWCLRDFAAFGRGTPAPLDAPRRLVVRGLYRYTRNPMYLGVLTVIAGWAILYRSAALVAYALVVGACFRMFVVIYEEPHLKRVFGEEYDSYRARVPRWVSWRRGRREV